VASGRKALDADCRWRCSTFHAAVGGAWSLQNVDSRLDLDANGASSVTGAAVVQNRPALADRSHQLSTARHSVARLASGILSAGRPGAPQPLKRLIGVAALRHSSDVPSIFEP